MRKAYVVRTQTNPKPRRYSYFTTASLTGLTDLIDHAVVFDDEFNARVARQQMINDGHEKVDVVAVRIKVEPIRAKS